MVDRLDTMESKGALQRFFVKQRGVTIPVDSEHIVAILAEGDYCRVHLENENHLVHLPLREFEKPLKFRPLSASPPLRFDQHRKGCPD